MNKNNTVHMSLDEAMKRVERDEYRYDADTPEGPTFPDGFWEEAWLEFPGPRTEETLVLNQSVVDWFKASHGSGWRQHMNEVLYRHMIREQQSVSDYEPARKT